MPTCPITRAKPVLSAAVAALSCFLSTVSGALAHAHSHAHPAEASLAAGPLDIFLNVDLSDTAAVGESLRIGLEAGLAVGLARYGGPPIAVQIRDHRNNMRRTASLVEEAAAHPATLALVGGVQSTHYLRHGPAINEAQLVLLLPWSAGATLTRLAEGERNHIFRLSVDDTKAAPFLAEQAVGLGCDRIATLSLDNGWGRQNAAALERQIPESGARIAAQGVLRYDAGIETIAGEIALLEPASPDCLIFVLSGRMSALAANVIATWPSPPVILSHWGMISGGFDAAAGPDVWSRLDIAVLSTCVLNLQTARAEQIAEALAAAARIDPDIAGLHDLSSPTGFAHAYDLGLLLRAAVPLAQRDPRWAEGRRGRGAALRDALEALDRPVEGVLKRYERPFSPTGPGTPDGHEALYAEDLCLSRKLEDGRFEAYTRDVRP